MATSSSSFVLPNSVSDFFKPPLWSVAACIIAIKPSLPLNSFFKLIILLSWSPSSINLRLSSSIIWSTCLTRPSTSYIEPITFCNASIDVFLVRSLKSDFVSVAASSTLFVLALNIANTLFALSKFCFAEAAAPA